MKGDQCLEQTAGTTAKPDYKPLWIAALVAAGAVVSYVTVFFERPPGAPDAWGQFGDFFGGIVNPFVGIITVFLVVQTLAATRRDAEQTRKELRTQNEYLLRNEELTTLYRRLEGMLNIWEKYTSRSIVPSELTKSPDRELTLGEALEDTTICDQIEENLRDSNEHRERFRQTFAAMEEYLKEYADYCDDYQAAAKDPKLADYYRRRVQNAAHLAEFAEMLDRKERRRLRTSEALKDIEKSATNRAQRNLLVPGDNAIPPSPR